MGMGASNEQKSLRVATINYMGDQKSPFQYFSQDYKFEEEKLSNIFKQNFEKWDYCQILTDRTDEKKISKLDALSKERYSPLYNPKCGILNKCFINKDIFNAKWIQGFPKQELRSLLRKKLEHDNFFPKTKQSEKNILDKAKSDDKARLLQILQREMNKKYQSMVSEDDKKEILIDICLKCFQELQSKCDYNILYLYDRQNRKAKNNRVKIKIAADDRNKNSADHDSKIPLDESQIFFKYFYSLLTIKDVSQNLETQQSEGANVETKFQIEPSLQQTFYEKQSDKIHKAIWDLLQQRRVLREFDFLAYLSIVEYVHSIGNLYQPDKSIGKLDQVQVFKAQSHHELLHNRVIKSEHVNGYRKFMKNFFGKRLLDEDLKISKIIHFMKDKQVDVFFILAASQKLCDYFEKNEKDYRFIKDHLAREPNAHEKMEHTCAHVCNLIVYKVSSFQNKAKKGNIKLKHAKNDAQLQAHKFLSTEEWGDYSIVSVDNYILISSKMNSGREKLEKDLKFIINKFPKKYLIFGGMIEPLSEIKIVEEIQKVEELLIKMKMKIKQNGKIKNEFAEQPKMIDFKQFSQLKNKEMNGDKEKQIWKKKYREWKQDQKYYVFENLVMLAKYYFGKDSQQRRQSNEEIREFKLGYPRYYSKNQIWLGYPIKGTKYELSNELYEWFNGPSFGIRDITDHFANIDGTYRFHGHQIENLENFIKGVLKEWEQILAKDKEMQKETNKKKYKFRKGWDAGTSIKFHGAEGNETARGQKIVNKAKEKVGYFYTQDSKDHLLDYKKDNKTDKSNEEKEKQSFQYFVGFYNWFKINKICAFRKLIKSMSLLNEFNQWVYRDVEAGKEKQLYEEWKSIEIKKAFGEALKKEGDPKQHTKQQGNKKEETKGELAQKAKVFFEIRRKILIKWSYDYTLFPNFVQKEVTSCKKRTWLQLQTNKSEKVVMQMRHFILFDSRLEGKDIFKDIFAPKVVSEDDEELDEGSDIEEQGEQEMNMKRNEHVDGTYMFGFSFEDRQSRYKSSQNRFVNDHFPISPTEKHPFDNLFVLKTLTIPNRIKRQKDEVILLKELGFESASSEEDET